MDLYLLNYNNYYNRIIKREENLSDYLPYLLGDPIVNIINWTPGNGLTTSQIINQWQYEQPNYVIAVDENGNINSRWWVIDAQYVRLTQYALTLRRDVVADYKQLILNAPIFVEKATLSAGDYPLILNREDMSFNQIKTRETPLYDKTGCPWIVGYIPKDSFQEATTINATVNLSEDSVDYTLNDLSQYPYYKNVNFTNINIGLIAQYAFPDFIRLDCQLNAKVYPSPINMDLYDVTLNLLYKINSNGTAQAMTVEGDDNSIVHRGPGGYLQGESGSATLPVKYLNNIDLIPSYEEKRGQYPQTAYDNFAPLMRNYAREIYREAISGSGIDFATSYSILGEQGKTIYDTSTGLYYRVKVKQYIQSVRTFHPQTGTNIFETLKKTLTNTTGTPDNNTWAMGFYNLSGYYLEFEQIRLSTSVVIDANRNHLADAPYDMFCMPYSDTFKYKSNGVTYTANSLLAINLAQNIGLQSGSGNIYDIQLLPYCPLSGAKDMTPGDVLDLGTQTVDEIKNSAGETIGVLAWCTFSNFTFDINYKIEVEDAKIEVNTDMYRLTSPNFNGQFEFNAALNGGVDSFNVDCTYKPWTPYIHINPNFKLLYGQDFNDARGLICGGDFSLTQLTSAWAEYEQQNKNYQNIFDRQIQNMEVTQSIQRQQEIWSAAAGALGASGTGAAAGMLVGGPVGAAVGGALSGLTSAIAGAADIKLNDRLRNEAIDYTRDNFNYQLGNIKALPQSIARTTALTYNNKLVPILEYYTCTSEEKEILKQKLKYNGMRVEKIYPNGINELLKTEKTYIKGKLLRVESLAADYVILNAIASEIYQGVFI